MYRQTFKIAQWAAVIVAMIATDMASAAVSASRLFTRDQFAYAQYFQNSADGCESLSIEVFASKSMTRTNQIHSFQPTLRAQLSSFNFCTGVSVFQSGANESPSIDIRQDLSVASTSGLVVMADENGIQRMLQVNITWSGGELSTDRTKTVHTTPLSRTMVRTTGSIRNSTAIKGALVLDGIDLLGAGNAVQSSGINGFVTSSKGSTIEIIRTQ